MLNTFLNKQINKLRKNINIEIIFLMIIAILFGLWGGLPYYHPDFIVERSQHILNNSGNPDFFNYPGLVLYLHSFFYVITDNLLKLLNFLLPQLNISINFYSVSHSVTVLFSIIGSVLVYFSSFIITKNRITAFLSSFILSTSLIWVANSHYLTVDLPLATFCVLVLFLSLYLIKKSKTLSMLELFILGSGVGLCAAAKYNGSLIITSILLPLVYSYKDEKKLLLKHLTLIISFSIIIFLLTNPFIILNFDKFYSDFMYEINHAQTGHFGFQNNNNFLYHIKNSLLNGFGVIPLLIAFIGLLYVILSGKYKRTQKLSLITFPFIFYLFMGSSRLSFQRYMLPLIPFLSIYTAIGVHFIYNKLQKTIKNKYITYMIVGLLILITLIPNFKYSIKHNLLLTKTDTRQQLINVLNNVNKPTYINVFAGMYMKQTLKDSNFNENITKYHNSIPRDSFRIYMEINREILFFDSFSHDRLLYDIEPHHLKKNYKDYEELYIIQITPFTKSKNKISFSPGSIYSPYLPDIKYRKKPGPFIEIYLPTKELANSFVKNMKKHNIEFTFTTGKKSYYLNEIRKFKN